MLNRVVVSLTDKCNLNCKHCFEKNRDNDNLTNLDIREIADWINKINPKKVGISGGEPFADVERLKEFISYITGNPDINIASNGLLITKNDMEYIKKDNITVQISIDGNKHVHDYIRGEGTYNLAVKRLANLISFGIEPKIIMTINKINFSSISNAFKLANQMNLKSIFFERYVPRGRKDPLCMDIKEIERSYIDILNYKKKYDIEVHVNDPMFLAFEVYRQGSSLMKKTVQLLEEVNICMGCSMYRTSVYIDSYGFIYPCSFIDKQIGHINNTSIKDLMQIFEFEIKENSNDSKCSTCLFAKLCGGCKAIPYAFNGNYRGDNELCWIYTKKD